jgi:hypothetical protein
LSREPDWRVFFSRSSWKQNLAPERAYAEQREGQVHRPWTRFQARSLRRATYQLYAFERDRKRFSTLEMMISKAGCQNVEAVNVDFLAVEPTDPKYAAVTHM